MCASDHALYIQMNKNKKQRKKKKEKNETTRKLITITMIIKNAGQSEKLTTYHKTVQTKQYKYNVNATRKKTQNV